MKNSGLQSLLDNLLSLKQSMQETYKRFRQPPQSDRERSQAVFRNFFLHIHSTRIHKFSLKPTYTFGLGLMAFFLFIILSVTGILLMIYYNPAIDQAYNSVKDISFVVGAGKYMRNIHRWSAHGMVFVVLLHMVRVFYTGSYKGGRGFNWQIGTGLLVVTFMLSFSGYLLPWDQLAYWAVTIGSNIAASPRELTDALGMTQYLDIGGLSKQIMIGGNTVGQDALTRFYLLHVIILPVVCTIMIGLHFWRIRKDGGLSRPENADQLVMEAEGSTAEEAEGKKGEFKLNPNKTYGLMELVKGRSAHLDRGPDQTVMTWPVGIWAEVAVFMLTLSVMLLLAYFFDAPLKELANPAIPENPAKAPWYFLGLQELVSYSAFMGGVGIPTLVVGFMLMLPYLDREPNHVGLWFSNGEGKRVARNSMLLTAAFLTSLLAFTVKFGWLRNWFPKISQTIIIFINPGTILVGFFSIWTLWILKKTGSTRTAALALFSCFLVSFIILTIMGSHFRGPNWDFFWSHADWPVH